MTADLSISLQPYITGPLLIAAILVIGIAAAGSLAFAKRAFWLRALFSLLLIGAILNPQLVRTQRASQKSVGIVVVDDSESQRVSGRIDAVEAALEAITKASPARPNLEWQVARVSAMQAGPTDARTALAPTVRDALASVPSSQQAGLVLLTDGQISDPDALKSLGSDMPIHAVITGSRTFQDRRLIVERQAAFAEVGKPQTIDVLIEDTGFEPGGLANLSWTRNDGSTLSTQAIPGQTVTLTFTPSHRGLNTLELEVNERPGEATTANNRITLAINGVRNRLRVVLVSGEPYQGERLWRSTLKSDPSVDLVHFTILRLPTSRDVTPVSDLSLIPFPTQELFEKNLDKFDLVIFDRYSMRGVLQQRYLANLAQYVRRGGALLVAVGPEYGQDLSLYTTPLGDVLPVAPRGEILDTAFRPQLTDLGLRHPVTAGLINAENPRLWGPWYRLSAGTALTGQTIMKGPLNLPLVVLDRQGDGRIAMVMSDQSWVWGRGIEGGGPYNALIRRLIHWLMAEPDLEEEHLSARAEGRTISIERRSLSGPQEPVSITTPSGEVVTIALKQGAPGVYSATYEADSEGLFRLEDDSGTALAAVGAVSRQEIERLEPDPASLAPVVNKTSGGLYWAEDGAPAPRLIDQGERRAGREWMGLLDRSEGAVASIARTPMLPAWAWLFLLSGSLLATWWRESR